MGNKPKILLMDIETTPSLSYIWSLWKEVCSMDFVEKNWYILCYCAKWLDEKEILSSALIDFNSYKSDKENDKKMLETLWKLLDDADVVIGHNARKFDIKKTNVRFLLNGMTPPSPYKVIDTLEVAKRHFAFTSNRLNDLGEFLGVGKKKSTGGFKLWKKCMAGDEKAWKKMVSYCAQDVRLLEKIYKKLLPYISNHPNMGVYVDDDKVQCPKCGSDKLLKQGFAYTTVGKYQQYSCKKCGGWSKGKTNLRINKVKQVNA
jgi:hypothetical protein